jgi:diacylglycerol kinase family enzyme
MRAVLVYNVKSGGSLTLDQLKEFCRKADIDLEGSFSINDSLDANLAPFIKKGALIIVFGGDGTMNRVAGLLVNTRATLVPLMGGTLNHFAKDLGVSEDIEHALRSLRNVQPQKVDVGFVNDMPFINNSSIGLYPTSLRDRKHFEDSIGKWPAAFVAIIKTLVRFPTYTLELGKRTVKTPFVFVGNNHYDIDGGGLPVRHSLKNGTLSVFIAHTTSRFKVVVLAFRTLFGSARDAEEFETIELKQLTINTKHTHLSVARDGEWSRFKAPIHYKIAPKALSVLVGGTKK